MHDRSNIYPLANVTARRNIRYILWWQLPLISLTDCHDHCKIRMFSSFHPDEYPDWGVWLMGLERKNKFNAWLICFESTSQLVCRITTQFHSYSIWTDQQYACSICLTTNENYLSPCAFMRFDKMQLVCKWLCTTNVPYYLSLLTLLQEKGNQTGYRTNSAHRSVDVSP